MKDTEWDTLHSTGLIAQAWFLTTTSPSPALGMGASLTSNLPFASGIQAAWLDMLMEFTRIAKVRCSRGSRRDDDVRSYVRNK